MQKKEIFTSLFTSYYETNAERMGGEKMCIQHLMGEPGRPRRRWEDNINKNLREV
jgi:hypothetical protein